MPGIDDADQFGDRFIEFRCDHLVDIHLLIEGACQLYILKYWNGICGRYFSYLERDEILSFCNNDWRCIFIGSIA